MIGLPDRPAQSGPGAWSADESNTALAHPARIYDYWLGGRSNYGVDQDLAEVVLSVAPQVRASARANREFLGRAVGWAVGEGVTQILDIGTGISGPGHPNQVARALAPQTRIVNVDSDPIVLTHAQALLAGAQPECTAVIEGDVRRPDAMLSHPAVTGLLDFARPVALLLGAVMHFIGDEYDPTAVMHTLTCAMPPGSVLVLSHASGDFNPFAASQAAAAYNDSSTPVTLRTGAQIEALFDGWRIQHPGIVQLPWWRPDPSSGIDADPDARAEAADVWVYGGVARKPSAADRDAVVR